MSWQSVPDTHDVEFGWRYRTSVPLGAWCFPLVNIGGISAALAVGKRLSEDRIKIVKTEIFAPGGVPEDWVARGYKKSDWGVRVTWEKIAGGTPVLIYAGAIAGVIAVATLSWVVVAKFTERELVEVNEQIRQTTGALEEFLKNTLFNPGTIIAALAGLALVLRRRR